MNYVITENKLDSIIYQYIDSVISQHECEWHEDEDYYGKFSWFGYGDNTHLFEILPRGYNDSRYSYLSINNSFKRLFNDFMGDRWSRVVIQWFNDHFPEIKYDKVSGNEIYYS